MIKKRVLTTVWALPLLLAAVWFDEPLPWFTVLLAVWGGAAAWEVYSITGVNATRFLAVVGIAAAVLFIIAPHFDVSFYLPLLIGGLLVVSLAGLLALPGKPFIPWAWMLAGALYIGFLLSYYTALRLLPEGKFWVLLALFTVFACDTTAFFAGRALGKHKLAPRISPGKTWEGAVAGTIAATLVSLGLSVAFRLPLNYGEALLLGFLVSIFGQVGDLVESLLKRNTGVKDSGRLMPGHGGILDRTDSVVFSGILVYYYVMWVAL